MNQILSFKPQIEEYIDVFMLENRGAIYEPVQYILSLGGKRVRPCLMMAVADAFGVSIDQSIPIASALEVFHNFTLLHDDIIDEADTRRGQASVHKKWNRDQAILSGDIMFAMSYELLIRSDIERIKEAHSLFSRTAKEVCLGQQMDMDFEKREDVSESEYLEMIRLKTSVLLGASAAMGAIAANVDRHSVDALYKFGQNIGISFQIQDDILDAFGDSATVGKKIGGDILNNKKTLLYLKAEKMADENSRAELKKWYSSNEDSPEKIERVKAIMMDSGALASVKEVQEDYLNEAVKELKQSGLSGQWFEELESLALHQMKRSF